MTIIQIKPFGSGGHDNLASDRIQRPPDGYAELPASVGTPETLVNFPFGDITVDESGEWPVVTSWTPRPVPEPEPEPEPDASDTEVLNALLGVTV